MWGAGEGEDSLHVAAQRFWFYGRCGLKMVRRIFFFFFYCFWFEVG